MNYLQNRLQLVRLTINIIAHSIPPSLQASSTRSLHKTHTTPRHSHHGPSKTQSPRHSRGDLVPPTNAARRTPHRPRNQSGREQSVLGGIPFKAGGLGGIACQVQIDHLDETRILCRYRHKSARRPGQQAPRGDYQCCRRRKGLAQGRFLVSSMRFLKHK